MLSPKSSGTNRMTTTLLFSIFASHKDRSDLKNVHWVVRAKLGGLGVAENPF
jgi:hypothetical protein